MGSEVVTALGHGYGEIIDSLPVDDVDVRRERGDPPQLGPNAAICPKCGAVIRPLPRYDPDPRCGLCRLRAAAELPAPSSGGKPQAGRRSVPVGGIGDPVDAAAEDRPAALRPRRPRRWWRDPAAKLAG